MEQTRKVKKLFKSIHILEGAGVHLNRAFGSQQVPQLDPFLLLDDFHSNDPEKYIKGFPWHPHRGIETISYILHGEVEHGDSMGNKGIICSGDVQWMTAGNGIIHQEMPKGEKGENHMELNDERRKKIEDILKSHDYTDYKWIDPKKIVVSQWVRMKCRFGCGEYGRGGACPPETPSVAECKEFFNEYSDAVILHFEGLMEKPENRHAWSAKINAKLVKLEREVFTAGFERVFQLFMDSCCFCKECTGSRETCEQPRMARPAPEAMAVDVYTTVRQAGFKINVLSDYNQKMDRFAFLMVQ